MRKFFRYLGLIGLLIILAIAVWWFWSSRVGEDTDQTLPSEVVTSSGLPEVEGLVIERLAVGQGPAAEVGSVVKLHFVGQLESGVVFDSSRARQRPVELVVGQAGGHQAFWQAGVVGMQSGEQRRITVSAEAAYGERSQGPIPPHSDLILEVELVEIIE